MTVRARLNQADFRLQRRRRAEPSVHAAPSRVEHNAALMHAEVRGPHEGGPPLDQALYSCQCGLVFEAFVSTSVDCPHCGSVQAW